MRESSFKIFYLAAFMALVLLLLCGYAAWLQLFRSNEYEATVHRQHDRLVYMPGERGTILDRNGVVLDKSIPKYGMTMRIEDIRDPRDTRRKTVDKVASAVSSLAVFLGPDYYRTRPDRNDIIRHIKRNAPMPFLLWRDIPAEDVRRWAARRREFPGTELGISWKRYHEYPESAWHIRGMTSMGLPVNPPKVRNFSLSFREMKGRSGMERAMDSILRGAGGVELMRTDVMSYKNATYETVLPVRGNDVRLTIDIVLQSEVENLFRENGYSGALLIMDLRTGGILVSVSEPSAVFSGKTEGEGAMFNRALAGYYPPGSTLKVLVAMEALHSGVLKEDERIMCDGYYSFRDGRTLSCSHVFGCGALDVREALARSCNTFFCTVGQRLGEEGFNAMAERLPLGRKPGTELVAEEGSGVAFVPSRYDRVSWGEGDLANASIGQGAWIITPLQLLAMTGAVVTGQFVKPHFTMDGGAEAVPMPWSAENRQIVMDGMKMCTESPGGTGHALLMEECGVLAKTGTAQTGGSLPHAIAIAAVPADAPRLAGMCIVENSGGGGTYAAPILRNALKMALLKNY